MSSSKKVVRKKDITTKPRTGVKLTPFCGAALHSAGPALRFKLYNNKLRRFRNERTSLESRIKESEIQLEEAVKEMKQEELKSRKPTLAEYEVILERVQKPLTQALLSLKSVRCIQFELKENWNVGVVMSDEAETIISCSQKMKASYVVFRRPPDSSVIELVRCEQTSYQELLDLVSELEMNNNPNAKNLDNLLKNLSLLSPHSQQQE